MQLILHCNSRLDLSLATKTLRSQQGVRSHAVLDSLLCMCVLLICSQASVWDL